MPLETHSHIFGVIGYPVAHSLSPYLHNYLIRACDLSGIYVKFTVKPEDLPAAIRGAKALGLRGLNVTVPHKQAVVRELDALDDTAKAIGAVNTIQLADGQATGTNTDAPGFLHSLAHAGVALDEQEVLLLGAGGAAHAVAYAAKQAGARAVKVHNRTAEKAQALAERFGIEAVQMDAIEALAAGSVVVNTTSAGMRPHVHTAPLPERFFRRDLVYVDLVYNPVETLFLKIAKSIGARTVDGLGMLIFQGAIALARWTRCDIDIHEHYKELRALLISRLAA